MGFGLCRAGDPATDRKGAFSGRLFCLGILSLLIVPQYVRADVSLQVTQSKHSPIWIDKQSKA